MIIDYQHNVMKKLPPLQVVLDVSYHLGIKDTSLVAPLAHARGNSLRNAVSSRSNSFLRERLAKEEGF